MGDDPTLMLNAPVPAARKVLDKAGLALDDIDLFEVNEAFAVVTEKFIRDLDIDRDKINVHGGAIALGHPIGRRAACSSAPCSTSSSAAMASSAS
jgi:acetyl-CoA C-acetyltransferase